MLDTRKGNKNNMVKVILFLVGFLVFGGCFIYLIVPVLGIGLLFSCLDSAEKSLKSK